MTRISWNMTNAVWFSLGTALAIGMGAGFWAVRGGQAVAVFVSGLALCAAGALLWWLGPLASVAGLWQIQVICLALGSAIWTALDAAFPGRVRRGQLSGCTLSFAHLAIQVAVVLFVFQTARSVAGAVWDRPPPTVRPLEWWALLVASAAVVLGLWDRSARFSWKGLYGLGLVAVLMGKLQWRFTTGQFFLWAIVCDVAGFVLVTALVGWILPLVRPLAVRLRIPLEADRWSAGWFHRTQALLALTVAGLATWIALDFSFDGLGQEVALFGLAGRAEACPATLMLIGTSILMAWQSRARWRAGWQYAAMVAGVLFTSSIGWVAVGADSPAPWQHRSLNLLISASMMTLLSGVGLARVLPRDSDWIVRARRAMPAFACLALGLLAVVIGQRLLPSAD